MSTNINFEKIIGNQANMGIVIAAPKFTCTDTDALAFLQAAGITDSIISNAICSLVVGLKDDGIWNKFTAIYPFVGGTASTHKWNLKDPRDLNAAYRLTFNGGWTHDSQGIKGNGANTYADTYFTGVLRTMGVYMPDSRTGGPAYGYSLAQESCGDEGCWSYQQQSCSLSAGGAQFASVGGYPSSSGFYGEGLGQIGSTTGYKNGVPISVAYGDVSVTNLPLGAIRYVYLDAYGTIVYDSVSSFETAVQSFSYFSTTLLTATESANLYTRVQAFQTALGREVANLPISDPDAFRYLNNGGIRNPGTSLVQMNALDNLAIGLKAANIWTKLRDIYPFLTDTRNIFDYSETFTNAYWNKVNVTITANTTSAPNNTTTASSFIETATSSNHILFVSSGLTLSPEKYTTSIYLKKGTRDWAYISMFNAVTSDTFYGYFNLATGTVGTVTSGATATIIDSGNGWYRCTLTRTMSTYNGADTCAIGSASADNTPNYLGSGGAIAMYIWGAQLEFGLTATSYQIIGTTSSFRTQYQFLFPGNLKDSNFGFNGNFNGGWTFSRTGARGNGINGYVQIGRNFYNTFTSGNLHVSAYSRAGVIPDRSMSLWGTFYNFPPYYGAIQATFQNVADLYYSPSYVMQTSLGGLSVPHVPMRNARGLIMTSATSTGNNGLKTYQNGTLVRSDFATTGLPTLLMFNAFTDNNSISRYGPFEISFISTGLGLTEAEAADFNTIVTTYQTALSRQIDTTVPAPVNTVAPVITGNPLVGQTLTISTGTWTSATTPNYYYRWLSNGGDTFISTSTFSITSQYFNTNITCIVTAISVDGVSSPVTSSNSLLINQAATNVGAPNISGTQQVGSTLTATSGAWAGNTPITFAYQWKKNGSNIVGATSNTYVLVTGDAGVGTTIQCVVTGTNAYGSSNANSNILTGIAPENPVNTVAPVISGTSRVGQVLTTSNGSWTGVTPITYTYQWKKNGSNIVGATAQTYTLVSGDFGASTTIQCVVTGTNSFGNGTGNSNIITGVGAALPVVSDPNAQAFINVADITDTTQANAINNLVIGLKADNLWNSLDDIYPLVGGNATSHKYNLKSPTGNQLAFYGGITHDSNGITGNGSNGFAYTNNFTARSYGVYSRTANPSGTFAGKYRYIESGDGSYDYLFSTLYPDGFQGSTGNYVPFNTTTPYNKYYSVVGGDTGGANELKLYRNGTNILPTAPGGLTPWPTDVAYALLAQNVRYIYEWDPSQYGEYQQNFSNANIAFAHFTTTILNATQNANLNARITTFQQALGREAITFDTDAQAFITAAGITNGTQQNAINTLVVGLKADGLWTKMNAIYPFVGGTATSHKFNLKNPQDTNAAFRIAFFGGWTHDANGITGNGTNSYADTFALYQGLGASVYAIPKNNNHWSTYQTTVGTSAYNGIREPGVMFGFSTGFGKYVGLQQFAVGATESVGFWNGTVTSQVSGALYKNGVSVYTISQAFDISNTVSYIIGSERFNGNVSGSTTARFAFASIGVALTSTNAANLNTRVQAFQTALGRQV